MPIFRDRSREHEEKKEREGAREIESNRINVLVCQHCWNVYFTVVEDKILATVCLPVSKSLFTVYLCGSLSINTFATIKTCTVHTLKNSHKATQQRQYLKEERKKKHTQHTATTTTTISTTHMHYVHFV